MEKNWVKIYSTTQRYFAEILKNMLLNHDIPCVVIDKTDSSYLVFGEAELYSPKEKADEAILLIEQQNV
ncbi:MAG: DUF2007 domain-containing protein [Sphingobacteriales bacterium]|nr:MAG: DUF2007 domain-containing protein [Sphingobacteriales bacterium]